MTWIELSQDSGFGFYVGDHVAVFTYSRRVGRDWIVGKKFMLPLELARMVLKEEFFDRRLECQK